MSEERPKAAYGAACNNCGLCCRAELCPLGQIIFHTVAGPCPALEHTAGGFECGVIVHPERYAPAHEPSKVREVAAMAIGAGIGCDARLAGESDPPKAYRWALEKAEKARNSVQRRVREIFGYAVIRRLH